MRRSLSFVLSAITGTVLFSGAAHAGTDSRQAAMDAAVASGIPGMVAVAPDWRGSSGVREIGRPGKPDPSGRFRVASVSKSFTATLVLQLVGEHRVSLDDVIQDRLPGLLPYAEPITVRQLLQHTSGVPRDLLPEDSWGSLPEIDTERFVHFDPDEQVRLSTKQPLQFKPGTAWSYSNTGYNVLGLLVEKVTHQPLARVLAERITGPLRLRDTFHPGDFPFLPHAAAHGYEQLYPAPRERTDVTTYNYSRYFSAGQIISSAEDLNRFFRALFDGKLLPPAQLAEMKKTVRAIDVRFGDMGFDYGLGLMKFDLSKVCGTPMIVWGHRGDLPGFNTLSFAADSGAKQISTLATLDAANKDQAAKRELPFVNEFCAVPVASAPLVPMSL
ncbi:serine hydrolase domain-containing protein [Amycolatopsis sp. NPDC059021]|uniref:serine hydrolase domain-containing protein n=1 Tax=Amycolatopsis sp. NPDC059021 TaxID=3346704 RepID=UPI0036700FD3